MTIKSKLKTGTKMAVAMAKVAGKKVAERAVRAGDEMLAKAGDAAKVRQRKRTARSAMKTAGKVALVAGVGATAVVAGRMLAKSRGKKRVKLI